MFERIRSLFSSIERRNAPSGRLADPWTTLVLGGSGPTNSGLEVSAERAMRCVPVYGAVKVLAETLAQIPLHLYRREADGSRNRATDHPLEDLLSDAANAWTPASEFRLVLQTQLALHGNAFAWIGRAGGAVTELVPLPSSAVAVEQDQLTMEPRYKVTDSAGRAREYRRDEILHIRGVGTSLYRGDSPVQMAREAIGLSIVLEQHGAGLFGRGARPAGILKHKARLSPEGLARLRSSWDDGFAGGGKSGRTAILEEDMDFAPLQLSSVDAQFLEMRKFQLQEIARVWRVPLHLLADLERVTHSNAEQMGAQFITYCILPITRAWQDAMRLSLLTPKERKAGFYIEFMLDDLARADLAARFTAYSQAIAAGVLNPNETRAMENRPGYDGGEVFTRPVNSAPVKDAPRTGAETRAQGGTILIAGPPRAGKTTHALRQMAAGDVIVDLDRITAALTGRTPHDRSGGIHAVASAAFDAAVAAPVAGRRFVVATMPKGADRDAFAQRTGARVVLLGTGKDACQARLGADATIPENIRQELAGAIDRWFADFTPSAGDEVISNAE